MKKMGKVVELKCGRSGRARSKDKDSDDSDEDYIVEEDEDYMVEEEEKLLSDEEGDEDDGEQHYSDSYNDDKLEEKFEDSGEEKEMTKTARSKRMGSDLVQKKFGTRASNNWKNTQRWHEESDDEDQTEIFEVSEEKEEVSEVTRSKRKRSCLDQKKLHTKASNNRRNGHRETDDEDYNVEEEEDDDDEDQTEKFNFSEEHEEINEVNSSKRRRRCLYQTKLRSKASNNRKNGHVEIDDEDYNYEEEEEDDEDEDFTLDESVSLKEVDGEENEEEEDLLLVKKVKRKNKVARRTLRQRSSDSKKKSSRRFKAATSKVVKRKRSSGLRRKLGSEDDEDCADFEDGVSININRVRSGNMNKMPGRGTRTVRSDSDFVNSGPSEAEFTISEEERKQVREANNICRDLTVALRSSDSNKIQDNETFARRRKSFLTKGKEKVQEVKNEIVKQVCGICFSEEGKNIVRGTLNCCSHYFCFTCILEWSKVESRCPLCKQRFLTISKPAKANTGIDLEDVVLQIPERDQVYQPTEEEIRAYLDPYENVICTECHEGGNDVLMLLCDLCDSPAHTYCVGLGWDVPEGNWYCDGCKPVSLGSSNCQTQNSLTGQRNLFHRFSFESIRDDFDDPLSTPSTPFQQGFFSFPSPRHFDGGIQAHPPRSGTGTGTGTGTWTGTGTGAVTVSGQRQIHRQIQSMFYNHRTRQAAEVLFGVSANNSHVNRSPSRQRTSLPARTQEIGTSYFTQLDEESQDLPCPPPSMQFSPVSSNHLGNQRVHDISLPGDSYIQETYRPSNIATLHNDQPCHFSDTTDVGCDYHLSSSTLGGGSFFLEEHVKSLVQNYLSSMSGTLRLGADFLEDVERKSNQTILAACGFQFHPTEVFPMPPQPVCTHIEDSLMHDSPIKGHCNSCFNNFAKEVVKTIMNSRLPPFLHLRN